MTRLLADRANLGRMSLALRELRHTARAERSLPSSDSRMPRPAKTPPAGPGWIDEITRDRFPIIAAA